MTTFLVVASMVWTAIMTTIIARTVVRIAAILEQHRNTKP